MRALVVIGAAALLAACGQNEGPGQAADTGAFPDLGAASYRLEATIQHDNGALPVVMLRDGRKLRMEMSTPEGVSTIITNGETGESFIITQMGGQTMAMRAPASGGNFEDPTADWQADLAGRATRTGSCSVAGQSGAEWTQTEEGVARTACVTNDGIILRATEDGRTVWETTSVQRGPQPADRFVLPPGVRVMDLGNMGAMMEAIENAQGN
jgi:hypothetical protein